MPIRLNVKSFEELYEYLNNEKHQDESLVKEFNEFIDYYVKEELLGLNITDDIKKLKKTLEISAQEKTQEYFGVIEYDKNKNITNIETSLFIGGLVSASIDRKIFTPFLLNKDTEGLILFHNHPSGSILPSNADIETTAILQKMAYCFNKEINDHFIVGKNDLLSFREKNLLKNFYEVSSNKEMIVSERKIKKILTNNSKENKVKTEKEKPKRSRERVKENSR